MKRFALSCLLCLGLPALAQEPYLVKDVNLEHQPGTSYPGDFATLGGAALFQADDGRSGRELWRSDGTGAGTWQVADLCPGPCSGKPLPIAATDRLVFFTAEEGSPRRTLWATDGAQGGAVRLTPFGTDFGGEALWVQSHGALYFALAEAPDGLELWRSDGTPEGTFRVADLAADRASWPRSFTWYKGRVWFVADTGRGSSALWRTDGAAGGTVKVRSFAVDQDVVDAPHSLQVVGKRLVFVLPGGPKGEAELWSSDGTAKGTVRLLRLERGSSEPIFRGFQGYGQRLYFIAEDRRRGQELWVTDGTAAGTRVLTAFAGGGEVFPLPPDLTRGRLVFVADDGPHGAELWTTDGTPKGTRLLRDVCPGACPGAASLWRTHRGLLYWVGDDGVHGQELWSTDGTAAGTRLVHDIREGEHGSFPAGPVVLGGRLLFGADDAIHGLEVWSTDGTEAGTVRVTDFEPGSPFFALRGAVAGGMFLFAANGGFEGTELWRTDGISAALVRDVNDVELGGSFPVMLGAAASTAGDTAFFFTGDRPSGYELWKSDGTEAGTRILRAFDFDPFAITEEAGGKLFFPVGNPGGPTLWRTDGTEAGTFQLTDADVNICCGPPRIRAAGGLVFFQAGDAEHGDELWASDGTVEGTRRVADLRPGPVGSDPQEMVALQGKLYFMATDADGDRGLWRSDGTAAGTVRVADLGSHGPPALLTVHAGALWFFVFDTEHGFALWRSDGTAAGTALAVDLVPGAELFDPRLMVSLGTKLVVSAFAGDGLEGLWATDGTPAGTERVGGAWDEGTAWTVFQGRLFYTAVHYFEPFGELTVSDGTMDGTRLLPFPGVSGFDQATSFAPLGDRLLFLTSSGRRLWETDGAVVSPITAAGFEPAEGGTLLPAGPRVFLPALGQTGVELWAVRPDAP